MKSDNTTKETILHTTFELLLKKGYDAVSITEIQKNAGISRGLLYHYYKSKDELFLEVTERYFVDFFKIDLTAVSHFTVEEMIAYMEKKHKTLCRIRLIERNQVNLMDYDFLFYQVVRKNASFASWYKTIRDEELQAWKIVLHNSQQKGMLKEEIEVEEIAPIFVYIIDGVWFKEGIRHKALDVVKIITKKLTQYYHQIKR